MASGIVETSSSSQGAETDQQQSAGSRSRLIQRLLDAGPNMPAFLTDLLTAQAVTVAGTEAAAFLIERGEDSVNLRAVAHIRPDESDANTRSQAIAAFQEIIKPCIAQGKNGAIEVAPANDSNEPQYCLVTPLRSDAAIVAVSAVITRCLNLERARQRLMSMELVAGYFELYTLKRNSEQARLIANSHQRVLQLATAVAIADGFKSAAMSLCNELANRANAVRVSLGWLKGRNIKIQALSHTEDFDKKQELVIQLEAAMEECLDQEAIVQFDPSGGSTDNVTRSAAVLSRAQGGNIVLSLPLRCLAEIEGVITLEFLPQQKPDPEVAQALSVAVDLLAPQLYDRYQNDRWLITKVGLSLRNVVEETLGPKYWLAKLGVAAGIIVILVLFDWIPFVPLKPTFHVSASFTFEAVQKRSLCAPFEGQIEEVIKRPGDAVKAGEALVKMRTDELEIQKAVADSEAMQHLQAAQRDGADPTKAAERNVEMAQYDEAMAKSRLYAYQIDQSTLRAPADGEVVKGDIEDKIGSRVHQGDVLIEVAQPGRVRAALTVKDRDIQNLSVGQTGTLATSALPMDHRPFHIQRIVPMGVAKEGSNLFTVYGEFDQGQINPNWLPGMVGEAKVDIGPRTIAWIWTHNLTDFLRLKLWSWM